MSEIMLLCREAESQEKGPFYCRIKNGLMGKSCRKSTKSCLKRENYLLRLHRYLDLSSK